MENLEFRCFDSRSKKMIYNLRSILFGEQGLCISYMACESFEDYLHDVILSQYTGKKDKTGKKIFLRDILEVEWKHIDPRSENGNYKTVEQVESLEKFFFKLLVGSPIIVGYKVIGNMDEHPELCVKKILNPLPI